MKTMIFIFFLLFGCATIRSIDLPDIDTILSQPELLRNYVDESSSNKDVIVKKVDNFIHGIRGLDNVKYEWYVSEKIYRKLMDYKNNVLIFTCSFYLMNSSYHDYWFITFRKVNDGKWFVIKIQPVMGYLP